MLEVWKANMPLKHKIFTWMCYRGRIQVTENLKEKGWPGEPGCSLCGELETANHLVFCCHVSHFNWWIMAEAFRWRRPPRNFEEFISITLKQPGSGDNGLGWALFGALSWSIWTTRNDLVFNRKTCSSSIAIMYKTIVLLSQWKLLVSAKHKEKWCKMVEKLQMATRTFQALFQNRKGVG